MSVAKEFLAYSTMAGLFFVGARIVARFLHEWK